MRLVRGVVLPRFADPWGHDRGHSGGCCGDGGHRRRRGYVRDDRANRAARNGGEFVAADNSANKLRSVDRCILEALLSTTTNRGVEKATKPTRRPRLRPLLLSQ